MSKVVKEDTPLLGRDPNNDKGEVEFALTHGMDMPEKTIGGWGSFVLVANNIAGPGLMTLPVVFQQAGIIPTVSCIVVMCMCSSFSGTLISEVIQRLPGNGHFVLNIEYSALFDIVMGSRAYFVAETFFIVACMVQACTGLVETAQSLDSFLASYLLGETYGLQMWPSIEFCSWAPPAGEPLSKLEKDAVPFDDAGPLVITAGYLLVVLLFFPLGRGHLKETMVVQVISFVCLCVLLTEFDLEFLLQGLDYPVPWFGGSYSQLIGVVIFNYAFVITIPAWLIEKTPSVSVSQCIWRASIFSSVLYVTFGLMAAMSNKHDAQDMLTVLAGDSVHAVTRVCAALFGVTIIGAGVPVFCVIIKNTLFSTRACDSQWSFFWGAVFPYLISWVLYQGSALMDVLNWAGLVVNGGVAFVFPLVVCGVFFANRAGNSIALSPVHMRTLRSPSARSPGGDKYVDNETGMYEMSSRRDMNASGKTNGTTSLAAHKPSPMEEQTITAALPDYLIPYRSVLIASVCTLFTAMIVATITLAVITGNEPGR